jgi:hypothetical protein
MLYAYILRSKDTKTPPLSIRGGVFYIYPTHFKTRGS